MLHRETDKSDWSPKQQILPKQVLQDEFLINTQQSERKAIKMLKFYN